MCPTVSEENQRSTLEVQMREKYKMVIYKAIPWNFSVQGVDVKTTAVSNSVPNPH
jgi:hypothetical protein